jgi:hypothetical protein
MLLRQHHMSDYMHRHADTLESTGAKPTHSSATEPNTIKTASQVSSGVSPCDRSILADLLRSSKSTLLQYCCSKVQALSYNAALCRRCCKQFAYATALAHAAIVCCLYLHVCKLCRTQLCAVCIRHSSSICCYWLHIGRSSDAQLTSASPHALECHRACCCRYSYNCCRCYCCCCHCCLRCCYYC